MVRIGCTQIFLGCECTAVGCLFRRNPGRIAVSRVIEHDWSECQQVRQCPATLQKTWLHPENNGQRWVGAEASQRKGCLPMDPSICFF